MVKVLCLYAAGTAAQTHRRPREAALPWQCSKGPTFHQLLAVFPAASALWEFEGWPTATGSTGSYQRLVAYPRGMGHGLDPRVQNLACCFVRTI